MLDETESQNRNFTLALGAILAFAVFTYAAYHVSWLVREPDLWWHIRTGQLILSTGEMPYVDTFSYTHAGQPWIAKEWLSQVIFALSYNVAGWAGPLLLAAATLSLTAFMFYWNAAKSLQPFYAVALTIICLFLLLGITVARPHVFTFPLGLLLVFVLFSASRRQLAPPLWTLLITIAWSNLHGSFSLAFLIAGCAFLDYLERSRLANRPVAFRWVAYLVASVAVTLINPYFIKPYLIAYSLADGLDVMKEISEWAPFTIPDDRITEIGLLLMLLGLLKARAKLTFGQIAFLLLALNMMFTHIRFMYVVFLFVPPVLLPEIVEARPELSWQRRAERKQDKFEQFASSHSGAFAGVALLLIAAYSGFLLRKDGVVPPQGISARGALAYVREHRATDPALQKQVFNDYNFGGPLILEGIKTYVDGRADQLFLGEFIRTYLRSGKDHGGDDVLKIIADPQIGWTIFPPIDPRNKTLAKQPGWVKTYADDYAVIYERRS